MTARLALPTAAAALAGLALAAGLPAAPVPACTGGTLSGSFTVIPGSPGAGSISYRLKLRNHSTKTCFVSGLAGLRLLDRSRRPLPTTVEPVFRGGLTAVRVVLRPARSAKAEARFSPDIPGPGEPHTNRCEPVAHYLRVTPPPGGGMLIARVSPPTPVCSHGHMSLSALSPG